MSLPENRDEDKSGKARQSSLLIHFIQFATVIAVGSFLVRKVVDADTWWQVAIGRDILANFAVPFSDRFAAASFGRDYHDSHWFFQVVVALADRAWGGMKGVELVMLALWTATFLFCYRSIRCWLPPTAACIFVFIVAIVCNSRFNPRPDIVTCFMIALFYLRLQNGRYVTIADLSLFAFLQVIWSNSHGLFIIGPFMAGCYLFETVISRFRGKAADLSETVKLLAVLLVATLVTPFGFDGWRYSLLLFKEIGPGAPEVFKYLEELTPTFSGRMLARPDFWCYILLLLAVIVTTFPLLVRRQIQYARLFMVAVLFVVSMTGKRNMPLFALTAAPFLAENIFRSSFKYARPAALRAAYALVFLSLCLFPISERYYRLNELFGLGVQSDAFPVGLPDFLRQTNFTGQIYNPNVLGGFCLYHGFLPLTDGRWEVYDQNVYEKIRTAPYDQGAWEWLVTTYNIRGVILLRGYRATTVLYPRLKKAGNFKLVYYDNVCSFWLRTD